METIGPHVRTLPVRCAPRKAPCPRCGELGNRKAIHHRRVRTIAYKQVVFLDVTYGEYRACCHCCTTFRTTLPGVEPRALYDNKVREAVLDRILEEHERRAGHRLDGAGLPSESLGRVRLRLPRLAGPAARSGGSSPLGPGPLQRDALRRRVAPWAR